jgi:Spy/CpxP family protein refolding chaperone
MKGISVIAGILALLFCVSVLSITSEAVLAQDHGWGHKGKDLFNNLTSEQRKAIQDKIAEMRSQGASREETHAAINEMLKSYGIEVPNDSIGLPPEPGRFGQHEGGFWGKLTEEQKAAVRAKMKEVKSNNASPEEMHTAIDEMLKSYGIEVPHDSLGQPFGHGCFEPGSGGFWGGLTKEQRQAIQAKTKEMRSQNATRDEIHAAVSEMLKGYGIDVPEDWPGPPPERGDFGPGHKGFWRNLTAEQREAVKSKIDEMRSAGASREEIRAAVDEMIKGYGIESPGDSNSQISEATPKENLITAGSYPNPFNPETQIAYTLGIAERVKIRIYNITGQLIRTFDQGYQSAGSYSIRWDGRNENGDMTASGVYLYRIEAGSYSMTNRMVLLK